MAKSNYRICLLCKHYRFDGICAAGFQPSVKKARDGSSAFNGHKCDYIPAEMFGDEATAILIDGLDETGE
jgi:hypothetical protein